MKKWFAWILALCLVSSVTAGAAGGSVTYAGDAGEFVFGPGSDHSLTDLFPDFKDVMPGDRLTQQITVRNDASNKVKVMIYIRAKGAQAGSEDFLSQLHLTVKHSAENEMAYMFDAAASETAQLTDWVCLGTLFSGGEVNLDVTLDVPVTLGNEFQDAAGYLDWEFMIEEYEIGPDDPIPPPTGDTKLVLPVTLMAVSAAALFLIVFWKRKQKKKEE